MKCTICDLPEATHIGQAKACFQGYGTVFKPERLAKEYSDSKPIYSDKAMKSVMDMYDPILHGGAGLIAMERRRQIEKEGWTADHDDQHEEGELLRAAKSYVELVCGDYADEQSLHGSSVNRDDHEWFNWPWSNHAWKPSKDAVRNLVKAGALIAAEIDRLNRHEHGETA